MYLLTGDLDNAENKTPQNRLVLRRLCLLVNLENLVVLDVDGTSGFLTKL